MRKIKLLDEKTINKIAAGEVVERPVAVVKELVENSIDALSTSITVEIKKGGISYIRITDNGTGMSGEDLDMAFIRHSTSKISKVEDLGNIITLGFRGEALASIAAVSRLEMITKERESSSGDRIVLYGGEVRDRSSVGTKDGTTIIVRDLLFNVPVRKGFLKSETAEGMAINDFVSKLAISNPGISFTYIRDGKNVLKTPGNGDLKSTVYSVMGAEFIKSTFYLEKEFRNISIRGYVSDLKYYRGNRANQFVFVNGRTVRSQEVSDAVEDVYREKLPIGKFPNFILFIEIDPSKIDVNMHPTKMEVRFRNEREVVKSIKKAVSERLVKENLIPEIKLSKEDEKPDFGISPREFLEKREQIPVFELIDENQKDSEKKSSESEKEDLKIKEDNEDSAEKTEYSSEEMKEKIEKEIRENKDKIDKNTKFLDGKAVFRKGREEAYKIFSDDSRSLVKESGPEPENKLKPENEAKEYSGNEKEQKAENQKDLKEKTEKNVPAEEKTPVSDLSSEIRYAGTVFDTYILCENRIRKEFLMIDQHAAHERILYEEFRDRYMNQKINTQDIMGIEPVELSVNDMIKVENNREIIEKLGFRFDIFGDNSVIIRGIPMIFGNSNGRELFLSILDSLSAEENENFNIYSTKLDKIMKKACTSAIKGGDRIGKMEADELIKRLFKCENPYTCPHGRPVTLKMSLKEIEKHFSRIQN